MNIEEIIILKSFLKILYLKFMFSGVLQVKCWSVPCTVAYSWGECWSMPCTIACSGVKCTSVGLCSGVQWDTEHVSRKVQKGRVGYNGSQLKVQSGTINVQQIPGKISRLSGMSVDFKFGSVSEGDNSHFTSIF